MAPDGIRIHGCPASGSAGGAGGKREEGSDNRALLLLGRLGGPADHSLPWAAAWASDLASGFASDFASALGSVFDSPLASGLDLGLAWLGAGPGLDLF